MQPKISIIIPIYNTAPYLRRCLDSVCKQSLRDIEIICINDASTDNSLDILKEYSSTDRRIRIIDCINNMGVAVARNKGILESNGIYLGFVDSDDTIDLDFYEKLYTKACVTCADITQAMICVVNNKEKKPYTNWRWFTSSIFHTTFICDNKIKFHEGLSIAAECIFMCKALLSTKKINKINDSFYNYYQIQTSSTHTYDIKKQNDFFLSYNFVFEEIKTFLDISMTNCSHINAIIDYFFKAFCNWCKFRFPQQAVNAAAEQAIAFFHKFDNYENVSPKILLDDQMLRNLLITSDVKALAQYFSLGKHVLASELRTKLISQNTNQMIYNNEL